MHLINRQKVQAAIHQSIIDQLCPSLRTCDTGPDAFNNILADGIIHNALTAHGASTHPAYDLMGYPILARVDCIPLHTLPNGQHQLDSIHNLPAMLQPQAY